MKSEMKDGIKYSLFSLGVHGLILCALFWGLPAERTSSFNVAKETLIEIERTPVPPSSRSDSSRLRKGKAVSSSRLSSIGLGVDWKLNGVPKGAGLGFAQSERDRNRMLYTEGKILRAFDQLALKISGNLDYPQLLVEYGVQGVASVELYFDHAGEVDESRTRVNGGHRLIRGLLVRASRQGLVDWYQSSVSRIEKEKFRNQYFRADFSITYTSRPVDQMIKVSEGSYRFVKRRTSRVCLNPTPVGAALDISCVALKVAGKIRKEFSAAYRARFKALEERLDYFDQVEFAGINKKIRQSG